ncbi:MAG TPA: hypothetical protein VF585_01480 [Chthoniobacterales bacterium]|jgi:hypothetical protein
MEPQETPSESAQRLRSLQQCRAQLDESQNELSKLRAMVRSCSTRLRLVDHTLADYFARTKNPLKLLWSRIAEPGAMRRNRKTVEAEIKAIRGLLSPPAAEKSTVPAEVNASVVQPESAADARHHVVITGTGRAGTTFLVQLLTALGLDTGYEHFTSLTSEKAHAGLEKDLRQEDAPYIVKNPNLCDHLEAILEEGNVIVDHAFVPVRHLGAAARSRERISKEAGFPEGKVTGGFWEARNAIEQEATLGQKLSQLIVTLGKHDVPTTLLFFPRLVEDAPYLFEKLRPVLGEIDFPTFAEIYQRVARPELVTREL